LFQMKQTLGMMGLGPIFDNLKIAQRELSRKVLKMIQKYTRDIQTQHDVIYATPQVVAYEAEKTQQLQQTLRTRYSATTRSGKPTILQRRYVTFEKYLASLPKEKREFTFNPNSHLQLHELLIDRMKLPIKKETKAGNVALDAEVMEQYAKRYPFCAALSKATSLAHLKGTFLDGMAERMDSHGRLHTEYLIFGARTGRPSSRNPNLNNIPSNRTAQDIKDIFCADPGNHWLVEIDQGQAEFRYWIHVSRDRQAMHDLEEGIDIHKLGSIACRGQKVPRGDIPLDVYLDLVHDVTKDERTLAKNGIFGLMYGRGPKSISEQYGITVTQAEAVQAWFFSRYPQAAAHLHKQVTHARMHGYVVNMFGRRRRLPEITSKDPGKQAEAVRQSMNAPIQGGASDIVLNSASRIARWLWSTGKQTRLVLTVYDSLAFNIPDTELEDVCKFVFTEATRSPEDHPILVPLVVEMKAGTHWGSLLEINPSAEPWPAIYERLVQHVAATDAQRAVSL